MKKRLILLLLIVMISSALLALTACAAHETGSLGIADGELLAEDNAAEKPLDEQGIIEAADSPEQTDTEQIPEPEKAAQTVSPQTTGKDEPSSSAAQTAIWSCTLTIRCDTVLDNTDKLAVGIADIVPESGVILSATKVSFSEGGSVFDILQQQTRDSNIHLEFVYTPAAKSAYIEGIGNLYEKDCGELSGWLYKVNGSFPSLGCSGYLLADGDSVEFVYTCDLGRDVGAPAGTQQ
jgi:hypothetical protein